MTIGRRLSKRAVVKENKLRQMCLQQRRLTPKNYLARVTIRSRSKMQTVTNGHVGPKWMNRVSRKCPNAGDLVE